MYRMAFGVFVLLLAWPALRGDDKKADKDKPPALKEQYQALMKEAEQARQEYLKAARAAETGELRQKLHEDNRARMRTFAAKFLALAEKAPTDPVALDALAWVIGKKITGPEKAKALDLLVRDHVTGDKLGKLCQSLASGFDGKSDQVLRTILARNPHKHVQAEASLALTQKLIARVFLARRMKDDPQLAQLVEGFAGKEAADEMRNADIATLEAGAKKACEAFAAQYSAELPAERLTRVCEQLGFEGTESGESFLRAMAKDKRRDIQGIACLALAQLLKGRAEAIYGEDAKAAAKIRQESEELFHRAADKYGDVKMTFRVGTIAEQAKRDLYELHHLSVGVAAPDIAGEDQDGKPFKLSDSKGKVVLLDFWSEF